MESYGIPEAAVSPLVTFHAVNSDEYKSVVNTDVAEFSQAEFKNSVKTSLMQYIFIRRNLLQEQNSA